MAPKKNEEAAGAAPSESKPAKEAKPKAPRQNGVTQPAEGSKTRMVWDVSTYLMEQSGGVPYVEDVKEKITEYNDGKADADVIAGATVATQYNRWRTFHGLAAPGRKPKAATDAQEAEAAPA